MTVPLLVLLALAAPAEDAARVWHRLKPLLIALHQSPLSFRNVMTAV